MKNNIIKLCDNIMQVYIAKTPVPTFSQIKNYNFFPHFRETLSFT